MEDVACKEILEFLCHLCTEGRTAFRRPLWRHCASTIVYHKPNPTPTAYPARSLQRNSELSKNLSSFVTLRPWICLFQPHKHAGPALRCKSEHRRAALHELLGDFLSACPINRFYRPNLDCQLLRSCRGRPVISEAAAVRKRQVPVYIIGFDASSSRAPYEAPTSFAGRSSLTARSGHRKRAHEKVPDAAESNASNVRIAIGQETTIFVHRSERDIFRGWHSARA